MKPAYKLSHNVLAGTSAQMSPEVMKVEVTDLEGVSWRDAKKQLRKWYTDKARAIRALREPE